MYNKNQFKKISDKKVLHKIKKHWVTISIAMLGLLGGGTVAATNVSANTNADGQTNGDSTSANHQLNTNPMQSGKATLVTNANSNHSSQFGIKTANNVYTNGNSSSANNDITAKANVLHNQIIRNTNLSNSASGSNVNGQTSNNSQEAIKASDNSNAHKNNFSLNTRRPSNNSQRMLGDNADYNDLSKINVQYVDMDNHNKIIKVIPINGSYYNEPFTNDQKLGYERLSPSSDFVYKKVVHDVDKFTNQPQDFVIGMVPTPNVISRMVFRYNDDDHGGMTVSQSDNIASDGTPLNIKNYKDNVPRGYQLDNRPGKENISFDDNAGKTFSLNNPPMITYQPGTQLLQIGVVPNNKVNVTIHYLNSSDNNNDVKDVTVPGTPGTKFNSDYYRHDFLKGYQYIRDISKVPSEFQKNGSYDAEISVAPIGHMTVNYINNGKNLKTAIIPGVNGEPLTKHVLRATIPLNYIYKKGQSVNTFKNGATANVSVIKSTTVAGNIDLKYVDINTGKQVGDPYQLTSIAGNKLDLKPYEQNVRMGYHFVNATGSTTYTKGSHDVVINVAKGPVKSSSSTSNANSKASESSMNVASAQSTIINDDENEFNDDTKEFNDLQQAISVYNAVCGDYNAMTIDPSYYPSNLDSLAQQNQDLSNDETSAEQDYALNSNTVKSLNAQLHVNPSSVSIHHNLGESRPRMLLGATLGTRISSASPVNSNGIGSNSNTISSLADNVSSMASRVSNASVSSYANEMQSISADAKSNVNNYRNDMMLEQSYNYKATSTENAADSLNNSIKHVSFNSYEALMNEVLSEKDVAKNYANDETQANSNAMQLTSSVATDVKDAENVDSNVMSIIPNAKLKSASSSANTSTSSNNDDSDSFTSSANSYIDSVIANTNSIATSARKTSNASNITPYTTQNSEIGKTINLLGSNYVNIEESLASNSTAVTKNADMSSTYASQAESAKQRSNDSLAGSLQAKATDDRIIAIRYQEQARSDQSTLTSIASRIHDEINIANLNYRNAKHLLAQASSASNVSSSASLASINASMANFINNNVATVDSYDSEAMSYDDDAVKMLNNVNVSSNAPLNSMKNTDLNDVSTDESLVADIRNSEVGLSNQTANPGSYTQSNIIKNAQTQASAASIVANNAKLIVNNEVGPLAHTYSSEQSEISEAKSSAEASAKVLPSSSNGNFNSESSSYSTNSSSIPNIFSNTSAPSSLSSDSIIYKPSSSSVNYNSMNNNENDSIKANGSTSTSTSDNLTSKVPQQTGSHMTNVVKPSHHKHGNKDTDANDDMNDTPADADTSDPKGNVESTDPQNDGHTNSKDPSTQNYYGISHMNNNSTKMPNVINGNDNSGQQASDDIRGNKLPQTGDDQSKSYELAEILLTLSAILLSLGLVNKHNY